MWCPYQQGLIDEIKDIQRRFCRLFRDLRQLDYKNRLNKLKLLKLSSRRLRYKLIFVYKMLNGLVNLDFEEYFSFSVRNPCRTNPYAIIAKRTKTSTKYNVFTSDVVKHWNKLTYFEVSAPTLNDFQHRLTNYFRINDIW